jgi:FlaA1/EpsC-like NDP-sugar epimerase
MLPLPSHPIAGETLSREFVLATRTVQLIKTIQARFDSMASGELDHHALNITAAAFVQTMLISCAALGAFLLRFDFAIPVEARDSVTWALLIWVLVKHVTLHVFGASRGIWRYCSTPDLVRIIAASGLASLVSAVVLRAWCPQPVPVSVLVIDHMLCTALLCATRIGTRLWYEFAVVHRRSEKVRTLLYGAGQAGVALLREARANESFANEICGFVDDHKRMGLLVQGVPVLGCGTDLAQLVSEHQIAQILIATPSATGSEMSRITGLCQAAGVSFKTMPAISDILSHRALSKQMREVAVEDVLGRTKIKLDDANIRNKIEGQVVLVSGAAGSIGSELCRQIARYKPAALVAFEISETALFFLEREMQESFPGVTFCPEIGSIQNVQRLREVFAQYGPSLVLHAAAYKHVPLMEKHMFEAVENNIFGTLNLATVAAEFSTQDFVMISTDKAVNPTNMMGTTKRVAELIVRSFRRGGPRYISVRFGNVLGSNGSVVPIFKQQIAQGGPVKVTHPDMERYFMTIPEASQLVLQASTMGRGGEVFVLDMGTPVKIVDLARQLIQLSGFEPDKDIKIEFTGTRPGEKLYEEINLADESMLSTHHKKIHVFAGNSLPTEQMTVHLQRLRKACEQRNAKALVRELKTIVPDYTVSKHVTEKTFTESLTNLGRVLHFPAGVKVGS